MKKKDKKLNKKAAKKAKKSKKNAKLTVVDKAKNALSSVKNINKDAVVGFAKKNSAILIAVGATLGVVLTAGIAAKVRKARK